MSKAKLSNKKGPGRPTVMTKSVVKKLETAFASGLSDREACIYAGISKQTLYNYCNDNPGFVDRKEDLKQWPTMHAKMTIAKAVKKDPNMALKYLERKQREEWAPPTVKQDIHIKDGLESMTEEQLDAEIDAIHAELAQREADQGEESKDVSCPVSRPQ